MTSIQWQAFHLNQAAPSSLLPAYSYLDISLRHLLETLVKGFTSPGYYINVVTLYRKSWGEVSTGGSCTLACHWLYLLFFNLSTQNRRSLLSSNPGLFSYPTLH